MASFLPSLDLGANVIVTEEEFFSFHNLDRQLFTRLVVELGRDTSQSTHVMAFIMWLENQCKDMKMVKNLLQWSDTMLGILADEATLVLNCIESPHFPYDDYVNDKGLPVIKNIMQNNATSFKFFYHNRVTIINAVTKFLNNVCLRAFTDIVQQVQYTKLMREHNLQIANIYGASPCVNQMVYYTPLPGATIEPQQVAIPTPQWSEGNSSSWLGASPPLEIYDVSSQEEFNRNFNKVLSMFDQTSISTSNSSTVEKMVVPIHDRIIFMTFSRGYPISKAEVRDYISRRYGDIIEAMYMHDVALPEQPLYARVVVRSEAVHLIDHFLKGTPKVRLVINGKIAWAKKYVRKDKKSPKVKSLMISGAPSPSSARPPY